jgi:GR25 family glycosyltransferase involved in LPS biosynthesis
MLNNYVDKVFLINLPHRSDRLYQFDLIAKKFKINYEVFEAIDGKKLIDDDFSYEGKKVGQPYNNLNYFKGCVGCLLSHLGVLKKSRIFNYERVLILEDDCEFVEDFNKKIDKFFNSVSEDWDMLYLGGSMPNMTQNFESYSKVSSILTTHSYIVHRRIYDLLISNFIENVFTKEADSCYVDIHPKINTYVSMPFLTFQSSGYSDIAIEHRDYSSTKQYL